MGRKGDAAVDGLEFADGSVRKETGYGTATVVPVLRNRLESHSSYRSAPFIGN